MNKDNFIKLKNQVWITRISRINAEKRLQQKEAFIQAINIYYSCITIIFSIMSNINKDENLSIITTYMTISLLIFIMYLSSQKYGEKAIKYRDNYTELHKLEFKLSHDDIDKTKEIEEQYCNLLNDSSNHITFDYYCTIKDSNLEFKESNNWIKIKPKYYWGVLWRLGTKFLLILLPFVLYFLRGAL